MSERPSGSALERLRRAQSGHGASPQDDAPAGSGTVGTAPGGPARKGLGGLVALLLLVLWKFKFVLVFLATKAKVLLVGLKLLKVGKLFSTGSTMLLSMWAYSLYYGAPFAVGFVLLILIHELGHGLAARLTGLPVSAPVFIPFVGAMIALKEAPRDTFQDFVIGVGGPLAGSLGGVLCLALSQTLGGEWAQLFYVLGYFTLVVNMFNLIPVWQLDGARITAPFRGPMWPLALVLLGVATFWVAGETGHLNPLVLLVLVGGGYQAVRRALQRRHAARRGGTALQQLTAERLRAADERDDGVTNPRRWISWGSYVGLTGALIVAAHLLYVRLPALPA